jgi:hypothetical protein
VATEYEFDERLAMSEGVCVTADVRTILLDNIPGALNVTKAHSDNDRAGVDWWIEMTGARFLAVDAKVRESDWAATHPEEDDLALETWSVVESQVPGWTRSEKKACDYVLWLWKDTGRFCLVPFQMLCKVFQCNWKAWSGKYKTRKQFTPRQNGNGYHSECVFVPRREVWAELYRTYGGQPTNKA